jgi:hypothetical protein
MTAQERLDIITQALGEGKVVTFTTHLKQIVIDQKVVKRFEKAGIPLFRVIGKSLYIARGGNWDCLDYTPHQIWTHK